MPAIEFVQRARALLDQGQVQEAVKVCRLGLLSHPTLVEGRVVLAKALLALGRHDEVLSELRVALEHDPDSVEAQLIRGEALFRKGDSRRAREVLERVHRVAPRGRAGQLLSEIDRALEHPRIGGSEEDSGTKEYPKSGADDGTGTGEIPPTHADEIESTNSFDAGRAPDRGPVEYTGETAHAEDRGRPARGAPARVSARSPAVDLGEVQVDPELIAEASRMHEQRAPERRGWERDRYDSYKEPPRKEPPRDLGRSTRALPPERLDSGPIDAGPPSQLDEESRELPPPRIRGRGAAVPAMVEPRRAPRPEPEPPPEPRRARLPPPSHLSMDAPVPSSIDMPVKPRAEPTYALADRDLYSVKAPVPLPSALELSERDLEPARGPAGATMAVIGDEARARAMADAKAAARAAPARAQRVQPRQPEAFDEPDSFVAQAARQMATASPERQRRAPEPMPMGSPVPPAPAPQRAPASPPRQALPLPPAEPWTEPPSDPGYDQPSAPSQDEGGGRGQSVRWKDAGRVEALPRDRRGGGRAGEYTGRAIEVFRESFEELAGRVRVLLGGKRKRPRPRTEAVGLTSKPISPLVLALSAFGVVAVAVSAGLLVRHLRMSQREARLSSEASQAMGLQTYRGYATALATYRALAKQGGGAEKARAARAAAALAFEFDEGLDEARRLVQAVGKEGRREALEARIYLALATNDGATAAREARALAGKGEGGGDAAYLLARALLLEEDSAGAADQLRESIRVKPTPLALTWLGVLEASRGRYEEGIQALEQALQLAPGHPQATIERLRLLAQSGKLGRDKSVESELAGLVSRWQSDAGQGAARAQVAWGALALAEVRMALGEDGSARQALQTARQARPARDPRFTAALVRALLRAGDPGAAREEVAIAERTWPGPGAPAVWAAWIALAEGKAVDALTALDRAGPAGSRADALAARGQARMMQGDMEAAGKHLDEALALMPDEPTMTLLRAQIDLEGGDARQAVRRLEPFATKLADPELTVTLGTALLAAGDRDRARQVLEKAAGGARGALAHIELGKLAAGEGRYDDARREFEAGMSGGGRISVRARLEAALLLYDLGNASGARESIDALAGDAPEDSDVLLVVARLHAITGDLTGAEKRLDDAGKKAGAAPWRLRRERGRMLLLRDDAQAASRELAEAIKLRPDDAELRILHLRSLAAASSQEAMNKALLEVVKRFGGTPEANLATGLFELAIGRGPPAINAFAAAVRDLEARRAAPRTLAEARALLGRAYLENGDLLQARAQLLQAAKLDPSSADPHYWLAVLAIDQKQPAAARQELEMALKIRPAYPDALFDLGELSRKLRDDRAAESSFRKYLEVAPRGSYANEARNYLR